jgi:NADH-quinone oxidoreductase subunit K
MHPAADISTGNIMGVALALFLIGLLGVLLRRNLFWVLMSLEVMLNAAALAFVAAGAKWRQPDAQVMVLLIMIAAAAEVAVGISLVLRMHHRTDTLDGDRMSSMRG